MRELTKHLPGRMRQREKLRQLIRETRLSAEQLVMPLFVRSGRNIREPIPSMPGQFRLSVDQLVKESRTLRDMGVSSVLLFGHAQHKDEKASGAWAKDGIVQEAIRELKTHVSGLVVITDVCLCAYTSHGHCGIMKYAPAARSASPRSRPKRRIKKKLSKSSKALVETASPQGAAEAASFIDVEASLAALSKTAVSHAAAGADLVAPSDMMDGNVAAIRQALNSEDFKHVPIMAYSVKYASSFYGPFREAVDSTPSFGDRRGYQMDVANTEEALREAALDIEAGADILMVKPAMSYLDIIIRLKQEFHYPVAAFSVSGEYAMIKAASARGWLMERPVWLEVLLSLKRAGADLLITYWSREAARFLHGG